MTIGYGERRDRGKSPVQLLRLEALDAVKIFSCSAFSIDALAHYYASIKTAKW